ncbi:MAG: hypothetical protein PVI94_26305 [Desulfobacterales bacterium]|jgi:hypothetical protein
MPVLKLATGLAMMALTIIIHALFMAGGAKFAKWRQSRFGRAQKEMVSGVVHSK